MEVAVAVVAGVVLVVIVSVLVQRRGAREAQSVAGYRRALDVLGHVAEGEGGARGHPLSGSGSPGRAPYEQSSETPPARFDDGGSEAADRRATNARRDRSLLVMERPARRLGAPLALVLVVLAAAGAVAYVAVRAHHVTPPPRQSASAGSHRHTTATRTKHAPPAKAAPRRYTAVASTGASSTYVPSRSTYSLTIGATTADCWMSVTSASGTTVLEQTFAPGASASLSLTGHSTILLGAPRAAKVSIGGVPVVLPSGVAGPYTVTLSPA